MLQTIVVSFIAGLGGLFLATRFIPGVSFAGSWKEFLIAGLALSFVLLVVRPFIGVIALVLRIVILGAVSLLALWALQLVFPALQLQGMAALLSAAGAIVGIVLLFSLLGKGRL